MWLFGEYRAVIRDTEKKALLKNKFFFRARKPPAETTLKQPIGTI